MALLDEVATHLVNQSVGSLSATTGYQIFKARLPEAPDKAIALFETGGFANEDNDSGLLDRPTFQVRVRSTVNNYSTARTKIEAVRTALLLVGNESIGGRYYAGITAQSAPLSLGFDQNNRPGLTKYFTALRSRTS